MSTMSKNLSMTGDRASKQIAKAVAPLNRAPPAKAIQAAKGGPKPKGTSTTPNKAFIKDTSKFEAMNGVKRGSTDAPMAGQNTHGVKGHVSYSGTKGMDKG